MAETEIVTPTESESKAFRQSMNNWMAGLQKDLPNPRLGQEGPETPSTQPPPEPETPPSEPATPPAVAPTTPAVKPTTEPTQPTTQGLPEDKWPRSAKEWKNFTTAQKTKAQEYEKQIKERDETIKSLQTQVNSGQLPKEIETKLQTLTKENDEFSKQLRLLAVTEHPKFKSYFQGKINSTLAQLKTCVPAEQVDSVTKLVMAPESESREGALEALMEGMTTLQKGRFMGVLSGLSAIQGEREGEIARAQQDYEQIQAQNKTEREQKQARFTSLLDTTIKGMQDPAKGRPEYQMREGETEWNNAVQKRIESGRTLITGNLAPEVMFKAAFDAAAYPDVLAGYKAALGEIEKLKKQVASMTAANPRVEGAKRATPTQTSNGNEDPVMPKESRPMDYTRGWMKKFGEAMRGESA